MNRLEVLQPKYVSPQENGEEIIQEKKLKPKLRQKDCYRLGWESILRAKKESFPIWKDMFYIKKLSKDGPDLFTEFLRDAFRHDDYMREFMCQSKENVEAGESIINDLVDQTKAEFEKWKKENQEK